MSCMWNGSTRPRTIVGRHGDECPGESCKGCQPCTEPHCRMCGQVHAGGTCAECLAEARESLHEIGRLCGGLSDEVEHRGIDGEAMMLLGPSADPESVGHVQASIAAGRLPEDYLDHADHELHPLFVLGTWDMIWRDALEHDEPNDRLTVTAAIDYLDRQLSYMAGYEHVPFEDFATALGQCRAHIENVMHDGEQVDTGAPCLKCGRKQERVWGKTAQLDGWTCARCKRDSTPGQYALAVMSDYEAHRHQLAYLPASDCAEVTGVSRGSISGWAAKGMVRKRREYERTVYCVEDVRRADGQLLAIEVPAP